MDYEAFNLVIEQTEELIDDWEDLMDDEIFNLLIEETEEPVDDPAANRKRFNALLARYKRAVSAGDHPTTIAVLEAIKKLREAMAIEMLEALN